MKKIKIPYYMSELELNIDEKKLKAVITAQSGSYTPGKSGQDLIKEALDNPVGTRKLSELSKGKNRIVVVTSDHTRAVPSKITLPILLREIRKGNPDAEITILIATGLHRATTEKEQRKMFGDAIVDNEKIAINNAFEERAFQNLGYLPSGAEFHVNKLAAECDLLITEGFIEPHFFAGFSGGRKSILPGICNKLTINENHSYKAISSPYAAAGILKNNPIHKDMVYAARKVNVQFILNVALNSRKEIIAAFAGDLEKAHETGAEFVRKLSQCRAVEGDIVITSNGGYPLDQNLYQTPKAVATAELCAKEDAVIIMCASCVDGMGGDYFERLITMGTADEIDNFLSKVVAEDTIPEQWCAQIYARILKKHKMILVTDYMDKKKVEKANMIHASSLDKALETARQIKGEDAEIVVIPDGVSVLIEKNHVKSGVPALRVDERDNVATVFGNNVAEDMDACVKDKKGNVDRIAITGNIPYGHKIAVREIKEGENIIKYGQSIGRATVHIRQGEHVHIHNMESMRGRGDLQEGRR